jgi:hypothetical protein
MKKLTRFGIVCVVLSLVLISPAAAARPGHEVPIKGSVTGAHWIDESAPGCDEGALWRFESSGTGNMSHLGRVDYELTQCTFFDPSTGGFVFRDGTITFTAANNDTLVINQEGSSGGIVSGEDLIGFTVDGTWVAGGGTGRFLGATGSGTMDGVGDIPGGDALFGLPDGYARFNFAGDINYNASNRSK